MEDVSGRCRLEAELSVLTLASDEVVRELSLSSRFRESHATERLRRSCFRSVGVVPPQTPDITGSESASSWHCILTGHPAQSASAAFALLPFGGKNRPGSAPRHAAH
jgi:hypothetical protein